MRRVGFWITFPSSDLSGAWQHVGKAYLGPQLRLNILIFFTVGF